jgi:hypothetical protein
VTEDLAHPSVKHSALCCPNCDYPLLETPIYYNNNSVCIAEDYIRTPLGRCHLLPCQTIILLGLMEIYPRTVSYESLILFYEFHTPTIHNRKQGDYIKASISVQISKMRQQLETLGIFIIVTQRFGLRVELRFAAPSEEASHDS